MTRESPFCKRDEIADSPTHLSRASWRDVSTSFRVIRCRFIFSGENDELTPDFRSPRCVSILVLWGHRACFIDRSGRKTHYPGTGSRRKRILPVLRSPPLIAHQLASARKILKA